VKPERYRFDPRLVVLGAAWLWLGASPAQPQERPPVDWSRAGGPLFAVVRSEHDATEKLAADLNADGDTASGMKDTAMVVPEVYRLPPSTQPFDKLVEDAAARHGLDPKLLHALVAVESAYRPGAVSPAGAGGLAQLMPATASDLGVRDRFDPVDNLNGGAAYLAEQLLRFRDVRMALAAYNSGPQRVARLGRVPDIAETRTYVSAVTECYLALAAGRRIRSRADCTS
jgi:soluble lytic murein transglycosylase-like protein